MTADFRCECGHAMSRHSKMGEVGVPTGCLIEGCSCELVAMKEPGVPSEAKEAATSTHALFTEYLAAGFTRDEALHLVTAVTVAGIGKVDG